MAWYALILVPRNEECNIHVFATHPTARDLARLTRQAGTLLYMVREGTITEAKQQREAWQALPRVPEHMTAARRSNVRIP